MLYWTGYRHFNMPLRHGFQSESTWRGVKEIKSIEGRLVIWTELIRLRPFALAWVVICLRGSGCIVVDRLLSLVIYLSVCGLMLVWMCVCPPSSVTHNQANLSAAWTNSSPHSSSSVCVFSCSSSIFIFWSIAFRLVAAQSISSTSNHSSTFSQW